MPRLLRVFANPYAAELDHFGRPHGHLQYEPRLPQGDAMLRFVGCRLVATLLRKADPENGVREDHDHAWEYFTEATPVEETPYYMGAIRRLELLPADLETHKAAFGTDKGFVCPKDRLAQLAKERGALPRLAVEPMGKDGAHDLEAEWSAFLGNAPKGADAGAAHEAAAKTEMV